jgi:hypothetical protein
LAKSFFCRASRRSNRDVTSKIPPQSINSRFNLFQFIF